MNKLFTLLFIALVAVSCGKETGNLTIKGTVKGLRKGKIYLQKAQDSIMVSVDSVTIDGNPSFELTTDIQGPEVVTLSLDKNDRNKLNDQLDIFAEPGVDRKSTRLNSSHVKISYAVF